MTLEPLSGSRVVDLYAGSGALGIETLSRGASWVDFVEAGAQARAALERNLGSLGIRSRARVWRLRLPGGLTRMREALKAADLVLADPPYGGAEARELVAALGVAGMLSPGARVVVEHHAKDQVPERAGALRRARERQYGETMVTTYGVAGGSGGEETPS